MITFIQLLHRRHIRVEHENCDLVSLESFMFLDFVRCTANTNHAYSM